MVHILEEKWVKIFLLTYLILVLICSPAISAGEAFFEYSNNKDMSSNGYYSSKDHNLDWLVSATLRKTGNYSNSLLRNRLLRAFTLAGTIAIAVYLMGMNLKFKNDNIPIIKNLVLLNLRI